MLNGKWKHTLDVSDVFYHGDPDDVYALNKGMHDVAERVERWQNAYFPTDWEFEYIADELVDAASAEDIDWFNEVWDRLYDWADSNRVWVRTWTV
jgi:hypothetical protein